MKWKSLPLCLALITTFAKVLYVSIHGTLPNVAAWLIASSWFCVIGLAMHLDRDLPMVGTFRFLNGSNQLARYLASGAMTVTFICAAAFS